MQALATSSDALLREARQLSADASGVMSEVLITVGGVAGSAVEIFATLLPWRRGCIPSVGIGGCERGLVVEPVGMLATRRVVKALWATWMVVHKGVISTGRAARARDVRTELRGTGT
jgi:hypothetical protein